MDTPNEATTQDVFYVSFCAEINPNTAEEFLRVCCELVNRNCKTVYVLFSTLGGTILQGIHIYNVLRALPAKIVMHNVGTVNSVGNVIFLAGDERYANPGTTFMFHGVTMPLQAGNYDEHMLRAQLDEVESSHNKMAHIIKDRAYFESEAEIMGLFSRAETRDSDFAMKHKLIHQVRTAEVPSAIPVTQIAFVR